MSGTFQLRYNPVPLAAGATITLNGTRIGGFLCTTTGTLTIKRSDGTTLVDALPVTAGTWTTIPFELGSNATVTSASAVGVIGV